jgi:hypothetical protein
LKALEARGGGKRSSINEIARKKGSPQEMYCSSYTKPRLFNEF